jgi:hypothetical protein
MPYAAARRIFAIGERAVDDSPRVDLMVITNPS